MSANAAELGGDRVMLTLRNAVDQSRKVAIEVPAGSTVREAAIEAGIAQGESFDVFTSEGRTVTRDSVEDHGDAVLYVGPQKVAGGAMAPSEINRARCYFPSLSAIKGHRDAETIDLLGVRIPDSKGRSDDGHFRCMIDVRRNPPTFFVLNIRDGMRHPRVYSRDGIPGTNIESNVVCRGSFVSFEAPFTSEWLLSYLNHTSSIMNE